VYVAVPLHLVAVAVSAVKKWKVERKSVLAAFAVLVVKKKWKVERKSALDAFVVLAAKKKKKWKVERKNVLVVALLLRFDAAVLVVKN
jgi:hypothetical protein